jgi:hypothetical protein
MKSLIWKSVFSTAVFLLVVITLVICGVRINDSINKMVTPYGEQLHELDGSP